MFHTCGIIEGGISDGEATCWGLDSSGQSTPPSGARFRALSAGFSHTCGIIEGGIADGEATCWGSDSEGQSTPPTFSPTEGNEAIFRVGFLSDVTADEDIDVDWSVSCSDNITTDDFADSSCPSGTVTIPSGETSATFAVSTNDDNVVEGMEEFEVTLTGVSVPPTIDGLITISDTLGAIGVTILDNDSGVISVTVGTGTISEGGEVTFTVELRDDVIADEAIGVEWSVSCDAGNGITTGDFVGGCPSGTVTLVSGETSATFTVSTSDDNVVEGMEKFEVTLTGVSNDIEDRITIADSMSTASVTILDNDRGVVSITVITDTVSEGEAANFRLELTEGPTEAGIGVEWSVSCEGDVIGEDFVGGCPSGTATIAAGQISTIFTITTNSDSVVENDERFTVSITGIEDLITISGTMSTASVTITDEAVLSVSGPDSVEESLSGMSVATFTVSLPDGVTAVEDITLSLSVTCATDVTGVASSADFVGGCPSGTETILAGETSAIFSFTALDDGTREGTEIFTVSIVTMTTGNFDVVFDDGADGFVREFVAKLDLLDAQSVKVDVLLSSLSVSEGGSLTFNLLLDDAISEALTLPWAISFDSASASDFADIQDLSGMVTIEANMLTSALVTIVVGSDNVVEGDEVFRVIVPIAGRPTSVEFRDKFCGVLFGSCDDIG